MRKHSRSRPSGRAAATCGLVRCSLLNPYGSYPMPRKSDGLLYLMRQLPWWVGTTIAFVGYVAFAHVLPLIHVDNQFAGELLAGIQRHSHLLGIIVAILFLGTAAASFCRSFTKKRQLDRQKSIESIRSLSWREFGTQSTFLSQTKDDARSLAMRRAYHSPLDNGNPVSALVPSSR